MKTHTAYGIIVAPDVSNNLPRFMLTIHDYCSEGNYRGSIDHFIELDKSQWILAGNFIDKEVEVEITETDTGKIVSKIIKKAF